MSSLVVHLRCFVVFSLSVQKVVDWCTLYPPQTLVVQLRVAIFLLVLEQTATGEFLYVFFLLSSGKVDIPPRVSEQTTPLGLLYDGSYARFLRC